uniref:Poly [ADP-ribose] polymerase n=1 Tax=Paramormyrops kingsleyae TaxID=1676925 RepID=A0A3B3RK28_9TELE
MIHGFKPFDMTISSHVYAEHLSSYLDCPSSWPGTSLTPVSRVLVGSMLVMLKKGDITQEKVDAIVNSTNSTLNLQTGVSGAILKAAGNSVVDECKALGTQPSDGLVVTKPGKLPVKHIVHMVGQTTDKAITSSMCKVLKACNDIKVQSVSFPALGTGMQMEINHTPPTWTKMAGKNYIVVPLVATSQEYQNISKDFIIERLQHDVLWQSYSVRKQAIDKKYPKNPNEQMLYHGTTKEICQKINAYGFNRSFCGRNATKYGLGTYFAKEAYYSCYDSYSSPDDQGQKYIYRARVLTGKPCLGESGLKEPKALNPNDPQAGLHDCAVDKLQNPFIFVVFCDSGAYPEYLITFKAV